MRRYRIDLLSAGYVAGSAAAVAAQFGFVSLFNNDALGRYLAVMDVGRALLETVQTGFLVQNKQIGAGAVNPSPLVTTATPPPGQLTTGTVAALPTFNLLNGVVEQGNQWPHDYPLVVLASGWSITLYAPIVNVVWQAGFLFEVLEPAALQAVDEHPKLVLPTKITLNVEAD